MNLKVAETR